MQRAVQCAHLRHLRSSLQTACCSRSWPVGSGLSRWRRLGAAAPLGRGSHTSAGAGRAEALAWITDPDARREVQRVVEVAERAAKRWGVEWTGFLPPSIVADSLAAVAGRSDVACIPWGGYSQAERCRLALGREELLEPLRADPLQLEGVAALQVKGNFLFDPAAHSDFLGAILGTGVVRAKVGDILVQGEAGAQILVDPELVEHFELSLVQVRTVPVTTRRLPMSELAVRPPRVEEYTSVEASMRLDAIASAGFRVSRSKFADLVKSGDVRVNWRPASKPSVELKQGDVVSCKGKGRIEVQAVETTKKDKYAVTLVRYV